MLRVCFLNILLAGKCSRATVMKKLGGSLPCLHEAHTQQGEKTVKATTPAIHLECHEGDKQEADGVGVRPLRSC